ncbi:Protein FAM57B [Eumeta japonica]|uniref:Protein FAM57B n=1 Tax=Eumeta variegata TaxID=151549 RepID=A0A4C1Y7J0_EUMVA|nr:Protein FAM57B [Eumeta japonica]
MENLDGTEKLRRSLVDAREDRATLSARARSLNHIMLHPCSGGITQRPARCNVTMIKYPLQMKQRLLLSLLSTIGSFLASAGTVLVLDPEDRLVSAVQAALSCLTGVVVCLWSCTRDFMRTSHFMSEAYAWFGAAYFFYDIWSMYKVHICMTSEKHGPRKKVDKQISEMTENGDTECSKKEMNKIQHINFLDYCKHEPVILMHHLFIGGFGFLVIVQNSQIVSSPSLTSSMNAGFTSSAVTCNQAFHFRLFSRTYLRGGLGDCVFGFVYLMELSTPFVSMRGILSRLGMKATRAYLYNGLLMLATFFVCRVLSLPYVCLMYSRVIGKPYFEAIQTLPTGCKISISILLLPQLYWFYLMSVGACKVFFGSSKTKKSVSSPDAGDALKVDEENKTKKRS